MLNLSFQDLLLILPAILIGLTFHEYAHGRVAMALGDNTPELMGRNTLNPLKHIDPVGFILLMIAGFGWAKPVMVDPRNFKKPRRDEILVSIAGPLANLAIVLIAMLLLKLTLSVATQPSAYWLNFLLYVVFINLSLMLFNLLPIPPLDGSRVLLNLLSDENRQKARSFFRYGSWIFLLIILSERVTGIDILPIGKWVRTLSYLLLELFKISG